MRGALDGIRILDLSSVVCGPMATQLLGDMGADIIKIEAPEGDLSRSVGPARNKGMAALFLNCNRNKRSVVLDLKRQEARELFLEMAAKADVVVHSIRGDAARRIGLDYARLKAVNPRLIYCHITGFSEEGPYAGLPAFDDIIQAASGAADLQRVYAGEPRYLPALIADKTVGVYAAMTIAAALVARGRDGVGQEVRVPMFETMAAFNLTEHLWGRTFDPPEGRMGYASIVAGTRKPYRTKDGFIAVVPYTDAHWKRLFDVIGEPQLATDPRFATLAARVVHNGEVFGKLGEIMAGRSTADWVRTFRDADIPAMQINDLEAVLNDDHLAAEGFWELREHPTEGTVRVSGIPYAMSGTAGSIRRLAPRCGEHTREVLAELGCSPDGIVRALEAGAAIAADAPAETN